jgi:hypothetical protein
MDLSRGLGDVYKRQPYALSISAWVLAILGVITTFQRLIIVKRAI